MQPQRRKLAPSIASRLTIASPLILLVTTGFLAPARANQIKQYATPPILPPRGFDANRPLSKAAMESVNFFNNHLLVSPSILDTHNTTLMRNLLLTHGIELDLGPMDSTEPVDEALLKAIFDRIPLKKTLEIELRLADASDVIGLPQQPVGCKLNLQADDLEGGVTKQWNVLWVGSCKADVAQAQKQDPVSSAAIKTLPPAQSQSTEEKKIFTPATTLAFDLGEENNTLPKNIPQSIVELDKPSGLSVTDDVPEGFEALADPQTNYVDIIFNGSKVASTTITSTPEQFQFDSPTVIAKLLPGIINPAELEILLALPMASNVEKICYDEDEPPGCGQVQADPVAAIYNESELTVELFLASDLQDVQTHSRTRYLNSPETKNTSIVSVYAVATDLEGEPSSLDLSARGVVGYGRGHIRTEIDYNSTVERRRLQALNLAHYFPDHELQLGTYTYQPRGGLVDFDLLGINWSTSLKTRVDLEHAFATELVVYLARRSVVRLAIDGRVYAGESYAAGNQVLDTRALPDGTYAVDIRILDPVSGDRTERRLFSKSTQIPPRGELQYNLTAGVPLLFTDTRFLPKTVDAAVAGASLAHRITDRSAFWLGLLQFGSRTFLQTEYLYLGNQISFQFTSSVSSDNTLAASIRTGFSRKSITSNLSFDFFESDFDVDEDSALSSLFSDDFKQLSFSLSKSLKTGHIGLRTSSRLERTKFSNSKLNQYALFYRRPIFRRKHIQGLLETNLQKDEAGQRINFQFRAFFNNSPLTGSLSAQTSFDKNNNRAYLGNIGVNWQHDTDSQYNIDLGAYATASDVDRFLGASAFVEHPWFASGFSSDWNNIEGQRYQRSSIVTLSAHAGADTRGLALGGADFAQAGVIISIKGDPQGEPFDILVNGIKASTGKIGKLQFIGLQPFENYKIELIPKTVLSNGIGEEVYEFTLYPGNVQRIDAVAKRQVLLIATLVNQYGELVENAVIERDSNLLLIEDGGFFQAEVTPGERIIVKPANSYPCEFVVPDSTDDEVLVLDSPIMCTDIESPASRENLH